MKPVSEKLFVLELQSRRTVARLGQVGLKLSVLRHKRVFIRAVNLLFNFVYFLLDLQDP